MTAQALKITGTPRDKAPEIALRGDPLSGDRYWSREFMEKEWERMWTRTWHIGGLVSELPNPGDFITCKLGRESILISRARDGAIHAFYNFCIHRGNRLVQTESGNTPYFRCTYHGWAFDNEGVLRGVQNPEDFPGGNPCGKNKLKEIRCETWGGFVWYNMDANAPPLAEALDPVYDQLLPYNMDKMVRVLWLTAEADCNWKIIHDNFNESYHLPTIHPELNTFIEDSYKQCQFDMYANGHNRMLMPGGQPAYSSRNCDIPQAPLTDMLAYWDLDPARFEGRAREAREALQQQKRKLGPARGYLHYVDLSDEQLTDYYHYTLFPNTSLTMSSDGFQVLRPQPHPTDPEKCIFDHWFFVPVVEGQTMVETPVGPRPVAPAAHEVFRHGDQSLGFVADQDLSVIPGQQQGLRSRGYTDSLLSGQEARIRRYHEVLNDYLEGRR